MREKCDNELTRVKARNIALARKRIRWSQQDLATALGLSKQSVMCYETCRNEVSDVMLLKIAEVLGFAKNWRWLTQDNETVVEFPEVKPQPIVDQEEARAIYESVVAIMQARSASRAAANGGLPECEDTEIDEDNFGQLTPFTKAESEAFVLAGQKHMTKERLGIIHSDETSNPRNLYLRA